MKLKNIQMETMLKDLEPILPHRDKIGYVAARNTRILKDALTEYIAFKNELIQKYGSMDKDENGKELPTMSVKPDSPDFEKFIKEFEPIGSVEHDVDIMTIPYEDAIGILNGNEILKFDWMFTDREDNQND